MELTDEELIANFRKTKDPVHFQTLVRRYQNRLYGAAFRILGSTEEAEEVVQETFIRVHQNIDSFRRHATFASWAFKIAHNMCLDIMRAKQRRKGFLYLSFDPQSDEELHTASSVVSQIADPNRDPAQQLAFEEEETLISESLSSLPDNQRTVLVLHDIEGFSYSEIAEIIGASIGTVRSRLHYGRMRLREMLEPYFSHKNVSTVSR